MAERIIEWNKAENWKNFSIGDFMAWHKGLVKHFGDEKNQKGFLKSTVLFLVFWNASELGQMDMKKKLIATVPSEYKEEIKYFQKYPDVYDISGIKAAVTLGKYSPVDLAAKGIKMTIETAGNIVGAIGTVGKILRVAIPLALALGLIFGGIYAYKKFVKNA